MVQKCLYLIQQGLGHHQTSISHTAQGTFSAILKKKYLLSPVPFQELSTMFSMVTKRKQEQMRAFWNLPDSKQLKNTEIMVASLERYLDLFVSSCKLLLQCRDDLTSCESNFAAPGSQEGLSPMKTFTDMLFQSANNICNLVTMKSAVRFESPDLYIKVLEFFCFLWELDGVKTCDLVFHLISAGFILSLIEVKVKYGSAQLTSLIQRFLRLILDCCRRKEILPTDGYLEEILNVENFKWHFSSLSQMFRDGNAELECMESYLTVLYLSCKYCDSENRLDGLDDIICSVLNGHVSLDQFTTLGRKYYIYLLSYVSVYEGTSIREAIPCGLESLPLIMQGPACDWYTHDMSMLEWVFSDPVLAGTSGQNVIEAFLDNTSLELMQNVLETEGCVECEAILKLCQNKTYLSGLVTSMASSTVDNVTKISLCLEVYLHRSASLYNMEEESTEHEPEPDLVDFLFDKTTEVLQGVFLQNFPHTQDHNIVGLLQLLLLVIKCSQSAYSVSVKVLYHVLNMFSKEVEGREDLEKACMLTVLAAVTCNCESQSQSSLCAIVVQHEGFLSYLQTCLDRSRADVMYRIACDILGVLIQSKNLKCDSPVKIEIARLVDSVCAGTGDCRVASMNLLTALFSVNMNSTVVTVAGRIYPTMYRCLYIQLQQCCLQENIGSASSAVSCMRSLISTLHLSDKDMGEELLSQPWNKLLLDVILDLAVPENVSEHHLSLLCLFTEFETGCSLIKSATGLLSKLVKFVQLANKEVEEPLRMYFVTLLKQLQSNFEDVLSEENIKWLEKNRS